MTTPPPKPDWTALFETASAQEGHFTTRQAASCGYSPQLLAKHIQAGRIARMMRGIYRLVHYPAAEHEDLVTAWLWSEQAGVVSHQTALALHGLSDTLPAHIHLTVPSDWQSRRLRIPAGIVLHHAAVRKPDRTWFGGVPATDARRTLDDCAHEGIAPDLLQQAAQQALRRGLVTPGEIWRVEEALKPYGGIGT